jgi:hypothetical protein
MSKSVDRIQFYAYDKTTEEINTTRFRFYVQKKIKLNFSSSCLSAFLLMPFKKKGNFLRQRATKILPTLRGLGIRLTMDLTHSYREWLERNTDIRMRHSEIQLL